MVGWSTEPETTRILLGDTGLEVAGLPTTRLGLPYFDTSMPANITAQVYIYIPAKSQLKLVT